MIIDFHTHAFADNIAHEAIKNISESTGSVNFLDGTINSLLSNMRKNKIDRSVLLPVATKPTQTEHINKWVIEVANQHPEIIPFGTVHPGNSNYKDIFRYFKHVGIKGVKFHPIYQDFDLDDPAIFGMISSAAKEGLILVFHVGSDPKPSTRNASPKSLAELADRLNNPKIVAAHMGGYLKWDEAEEHLVGKNIYFDMSYVADKIPIKQLVKIIKEHGTDKILFGTDSPWANPQDLFYLIKRLNFNKSDEMLIFQKNAEKLLNITV